MLVVVLPSPRDPDQSLPATRPDRHDQPPTDGELLEKSRGDASTTGGHDDHVVRGVFGPPPCAVSVKNVDVRVSELGQTITRSPGQALDPLDRVDLRGDPRQHGRRVAGP